MTADAFNFTEKLIVIIKVNINLEETDYEGKEHWPLLGEIAPGNTTRKHQLKYHNCGNNRKYSITKSFYSTFLNHLFPFNVLILL